MASRAAAVCLWCLAAPRATRAAAPSWLPASLRELEDVTVPGAWEALLAFFRPGGGGSERYRIVLDPSCVDGELRPGSWGEGSSGLAWDDKRAPWWRPEAFALTHGKWSAEVWLPLALARSRWGARGPAEAAAANATVVLFQSRKNGRQALSWCRRKVAAASATWRLDRGGKGVIQRRFNVGVFAATPERNASTL